MLYGMTANREVRVYEVDLFATSNPTKLLTKVANAHAMLEATIYTSQAFYLEGYRHHEAHGEGQLLNEILREQLNSLNYCVAILQDNFIGYYKNGFLVATDSLSKFTQPLKC